MRSRARALVLVGLAATGAAAQPPASEPAPAPSTAQPAYDQVGYAVPSPDATVGHTTLPAGSVAEVTALDSGRTMLVRIGRAAGPGREIELPTAVMTELGLAGGARAPVRVRMASATPADLVALDSRSAIARPDAPPVLLTALRRKLAGEPARAAAMATPSPSPATSTRAVLKPILAKAAPPRAAPLPKAAPPPRTAPTPPRTAPPPTVARAGYYVQIAALSDAGRAAALARSVGGQVSSVRQIHRVRLGPFTDPRFASAARDAVARRGYGGARIVRD